MNLSSLWDIQQLLKRYGIFVYVGDRAANIEMMELEIRELYHSKLIEVQEFQKAVLILRSELEREKQKKIKRQTGEMDE
ncbi:YqgQ family protein [Jeotgalibacillus proteolyticus]|uniref:DUF910 domain-containing protein n=1 Tax=Jeotgalibacillus proteolyticus TaxID=2082395 RepID=A0A2S5GED3_9BACL|nr:YqgQ family protein [Jeotgalibacillus proteolyticus]PPA71412.1 DUF910 domain-containing protein [Jeotgalibacillus proteolyticus]